MTTLPFDLNEISIEYAEAVRAVAAIAGRPPHPDPHEEIVRQRLLRLAMTRESDLRCRRDILVGAIGRQRGPADGS